MFNNGFAKLNVEKSYQHHHQTAASKKEKKDDVLTRAEILLSVDVVALEICCRMAKILAMSSTTTPEGPPALSSWSSPSWADGAERVVPAIARFQ